MLYGVFVENKSLKTYCKKTMVKFHTQSSRQMENLILKGWHSLCTQKSLNFLRGNSKNENDIK